MIRAITKEDIPECVNVIRTSFLTVAEEFDITPENSQVVAYIFEKIPEIARSLGVDEKGFRIVNNCGDCAGQSVKHLHFHLMAGREFTWPAG